MIVYWVGLEAMYRGNCTEMQEIISAGTTAQLSRYEPRSKLLTPRPVHRIPTWLATHALSFTYFASDDCFTSWASLILPLTSTPRNRSTLTPRCPRSPHIGCFALLTLFLVRSIPPQSLAGSFRCFIGFFAGITALSWIIQSLPGFAPLSLNSYASATVIDFIDRSS